MLVYNFPFLNGYIKKKKAGINLILWKKFEIIKVHIKRSETIFPGLK